MRAILFEDVGRVAVGEYPQPEVTEPRDAIVRVTTAAICGSDLHVLHGRLPGVREGSVLGHEYVGEIVAVGDEVRRFATGDRVVGSFPIVCGSCWYCARGIFNNCEDMRILGYGIFVGDLDGSQAEYVRVPVADMNLQAVDPALSDEQAIFAGDILSTGYYIAARSRIEPGDTVAVIGAGPVGLCALMAAGTFEPSAVYVVDQDRSRLAVAEKLGGIPVDATKVNAVVDLQRRTGDRGVDVALECVGSPQTVALALDAVRQGGTAGIIGVITEIEVPFPLAEVWRRNVTIVMGGVADVQGTWSTVLELVRTGALDPAAIITHTMSLDEGVRGYELFAAREALKVILKP